MPVGIVATSRSIASRHAFRRSPWSARHEPGDFLREQPPVVDDDRRERPHVHHDVEEEADLAEPRHQHLGGGEVAVGGNGDEFGQALDHAQDDRVEPAHALQYQTRARQP